MRFVTLYDGFQEIPADIHTHITHTFMICATLPAEVAQHFHRRSNPGQIRSLSASVLLLRGNVTT